MRVLENAVRLRRATGGGCGVRRDMTQRTVGWSGVESILQWGGWQLVRCSDVLSEIEIALFFIFLGYESLDG